MKLWKFISDRMERHPEQTVSDGASMYTFRDLLRFARSVAAELSGENCCAVCCRSELLCGIAVLGCMAAGVTALPLSPKYGTSHVSHILHRVSPTAIITDCDGEIGVMHITDSSYTPPDTSPALIMCTSGTTGHPKGAMLSDENIITNLTDIAKYLPLDPSDRILISRPLYHSGVLTGEFLTALAAGSGVIFHSNSFTPPVILKTVRERLVTVLGGTPTTLRMIARFASARDVKSLRRIIISGECLRSGVASEIRRAFPDASIYHVYGLTEASPRVAHLPPALFDTHPEYVGVPLDSVEVRILDADGRDAAPGEDGELVVRGGNVMMGYYNEPVMTSKAISDGWLRTGDRALMNGDGLIRILGRCDDMIIRAGVNIYPQEIEDTLKSDPRVNEVLAFGFEGACGTEEIGLRICGNFNDESEVRTLCIGVLPKFAVPSRIELTDHIELSGSGKVIRGRRND